MDHCVGEAPLRLNAWMATTAVTARLYMSRMGGLRLLPWPARFEWSRTQKVHCSSSEFLVRVRSTRPIQVLSIHCSLGQSYSRKGTTERAKPRSV
jgi:hypothetical protein